MSRKTLSIVVIIQLITVTLISGCCCCGGSTPSAVSPTPAASPIDVACLELPDHRSFYMGMTPLPYDYSARAVSDTYRLTDQHTDLIMQHFDQGVPWPEAYENKPFDPAIEADLKDRISHERPGEYIYLSMTPVAFLRDGMAPYWGKEGNLERPGEWKNRDFDDPEVVQAYTNYCRYMIKKFNPDYVAYGIEVNMLAQKSPVEFEKYVNMTSQVYRALKAENPDLPLILTLQADTFHEDEAGQREAIKKLLPYTDYIAVSTYPYGKYPDPGDIPEDWFSDLKELAPEKPFSIAETGYIAEDLALPQYSASIKGSEEHQAEYVKLLLENADDLDARFVVWFVPRDYDLLWEKLAAGGADELLKLWKDTGLADGSGKPRQSLGIWDAWLALPVKNSS